MKEDLELELNYFDEEKQEDKLWMARTGLNKETLCGAVETVIFMSDKPLPLSKIRSLIDEDLPLRVLHEALLRLQEEYEAKHHGIRLKEVAQGYQFRTKTTYSQYVQDLFKVNSLVLSPTALEVLAIIAYKQPIARTEVDKVRGVDSGHIVRGLMDKRLVKIVGKSDEMGRPILYGTTPEFLSVFNLASLDELPSEGELERDFKEEVQEVSDLKEIIRSGNKDRFVFEDTRELDELAESIKTIPVDTPFTSSLKSEEKKQTKEGQRGLSAFDLLEEYVHRQIIAHENKGAEDSALPSKTCHPSVLKDLKSSISLPSSELEFDQEGLHKAVESLEEKNGQIEDKTKDLDVNLDF